MTTRIDGYLSRLAQNHIDKTSLVLVRKTDQGEEWVLERKNQPDLGLGGNYHLAEQGIRAMIRAAEARHGKK